MRQMSMQGTLSQRLGRVGLSWITILRRECHRNYPKYQATIIQPSNCGRKARSQSDMRTTIGLTPSLKKSYPPDSYQCTLPRGGLKKPLESS